MWCETLTGMSGGCWVGWIVGVHANKGIIKHRLTIQAYETEIDKFLIKVEEGLLVGSLVLPLSMAYGNLVPFLETLCIKIQLDDDNRGRINISVDDDLLILSLDPHTDLGCCANYTRIF